MSNSTVNGTDWSPDVTVGMIAFRSYYERQIVASLFTIACIGGTIGNTFVLFAVLSHRKLRTVTNVFVASLSISDLLTCMFLPWQTVAVLSETGRPLHDAPWICVATTAVINTSSRCSITNLALIAVNRWIGITKSSATTRRIYTRRNIACMVAFSWAFPMCFALIPVLTDFGEFGYDSQLGICSWVNDNPYSTPHALIFSICCFPGQLGIILACYTSIYFYVIKTSRRTARRGKRSVSGAVSGPERAMRKMLWRRQIAVTKNLVFIVMAFVICSSPLFVAMIQQKRDWGVRMTPFALAIFFCNICVNPIVYATTHPDFKEAFAYMVKG